MNRLLTFFLALSVSQITFSQTDVTVSTGAGYTNQVWYTLSNDEITSLPLTAWDLAFEIEGFTASILINNAKGNLLTAHPFVTASVDNFLALDTTGYSGWTPRFNSDTSWSFGAFNQYFSNEFDLDWGMYDMATHYIIGDSLYLVSLPGGDVKKLWIQSLATGVFTFRYANLDNSEDHTVSLTKSDFNGKNFAYYSLIEHAELNPEPPSADWDLLFTKYTTLIPMPELVPYSVTGVLTNIGVTIVQADDVDVTSDEYAGYDFQSEINIIGYDWKTYDFPTNSYLITENRAYFVAKQNGEIWKLILTGFEGSTSGNYYFTKEQLTTVVGVSDNSNAQLSISVYPNIISNEVARVITNSSSFIENGKIVIYNQVGAVVKQINDFTINSGLNTTQLFVGDLSQGLYFVSLQTSNDQLTHKIIIE